jgi:Mce-associated membrane protein
MRRLGKSLAAVLAVVLSAGFVALAGAGGWYFWSTFELKTAQDARIELESLAAEQIPKVFTYDYKTVERSLIDASQMLTPQYRAEFDDRAEKDIIPQARDRQLVSQAHVVGVGVLDAQRVSASVLVFMNRTVTDKSKTPVYDGSRLRVDYQRVDGKWLINYITPI